MSWTWTTGETEDAPAVAITYGWGPLHAFHKLIAAEEGINLRPMRDYGGSQPWTDAITPLRIVFDMDYIESHQSLDRYPEAIARLRDIHARWSTDTFPESTHEWLDDIPWMKELQAHSLGQLITVMDTARARNKPVRLDHRRG